MRYFVTAAALTLAAASPAASDQYVVQLDAAYTGATENLKTTLHVSEVESFSVDGQHYVILDAPNEAYVEAFFIALHRKAVELNVLEANWTLPVMSNMTHAERLGFLKPIECEFCAS